MCTACACGTADTASAQVATSGGTVYQVSGMTCGHCVSSISAEIGKVDGVTGVQVDLAGGAVTVSGAGFSGEEIRTAVDQAGYAPADTSPVSPSQTEAGPLGG
ncbi:copper chaperone CopZ [Streptosporangium album]|uniref:Copper chaperone CopZ n=1 Tax=Streptosporangium album TaxID=47479 RepID=A0A7W7WF05_9ACTN|nr:heavy-metal-associated domain-containing protein [Streptosporangium album]MBB4943980.1 copper chaperone CopZ [Streptosporangium album]